MKQKALDLFWHRYKYYPYEVVLARREIEALLAPRSIREIPGGLRLSAPARPETANRLVYFAGAGPDGSQTSQARLERVNGNGPNRQSTRYSAHGLHEYKGRFNPQIAKAILNTLGIPSGARVLDPFCGSGTSLIEAAHLGMRAIGTDINPLAIFLANAKAASLTLAPAELRAGLRAVQRKRAIPKRTGDAREAYLDTWFTPPVFQKIELLREALSGIEPIVASILFACASNLLRDYSLQDPIDLRIRRRKTPLPEKPFLEAFAESVERFAVRIADARDTLSDIGSANAVLLDSRKISPKQGGLGNHLFDCALTSPPYATALPYIDTQRLSLVWLGLIPPEEILPLDARLVGSRESRGHERKMMAHDLAENAAGLPSKQAEYCIKLLHAMGESDGFRRKAVPSLLYRYFVGMRDSFRSIRTVMREGAPYVLIVGGNHTTLGGKRFDIDTPSHLAAIAESAGWRTREILPLQTYQRYGYHMSNAVASEAMVILEAA